MAKLGRRRLILISLEDPAGTAVAGATTLWTYDASMDDATEVNQREFSGAYGGQASSTRGPSVGTCKFRTEVRSNGVSALDAGLLIALQGCGQKLVEGVLTPATAIPAQKTVTIDLYADGRKKRLFGAVGDVQLSGDLQKTAILEFTFSGRYYPMGNAALPAVAPPTGGPMRLTGMSFGAYAPKFKTLRLSLNNTVEPREDQAAEGAFAGDVGGIGRYLIGPGRRYMIEIDPEQEDAGSFDAEALAAANTISATTVTFSDGVVTLTLAAPKGQLMSPSDSTRDSKATNGVQIQCNGSLGDDDLSWTAAAV